MTPSRNRIVYGAVWAPDVPDLGIELACIQRGGRWVYNGIECGKGLFHHYRRAQELCWPEDDHHRWSDLMLKTILEERITVVQGARDSGKTHTMSKFALIDYWAFPDDTLILMSSTDIRGLELRVWGDIKDLFQRARERYPFLSGTTSESKHGIFTDSLNDSDDVRDIRKGIICIPCLGSDGQWAGGLEKFVGIKQKRRRLLGDEVQFMHLNYLTTLANLDKGEFKGVFVGNPIGGNGKALDKVAEPPAGWNSLGEITKTITWRNRFDGVTINLVGIDSPNFDKDRPKRYPYLIDQSDVDRVARRSGKDSAEYWSQIMGVRQIGVDRYRVLTRSICLQHHAFEQAVWSGGETIKVMGIDAGYGGDTCESIVLEFGPDVNGRTIIKFNPTVAIPILIGDRHPTPEDQIAAAVKLQADALAIPGANIFVECGMRATLGISMAKFISNEITPVNAGGPVTDRPVSNDVFVLDHKTRVRRLMMCSEYYVKFITEMWYSVREAVESDQVREIPEPVVDQFAMREWKDAPGNKKQLETKDECKARMGESPNKADAAAIALEGARRLGFMIERIPSKELAQQEADDWLARELDKEQSMKRRYELKYV